MRLTGRNPLLALTLVLVTGLSVHAQYGQYSSRSLLEKKLFYIDDQGKSSTCSFWALFLGTYKVTIPKEFPGEGVIDLKAEVNYSFLSSIYIEGRGYSNRGKLETDAEFAIAVPDSTGDSLTILHPGDIDYVYGWGEKVKTTSGIVADLLLKTRGDVIPVRQLLLRAFNFNKEFGDLKFDRDINLKAFAFTKEGIARAAAATKE